MQNNKDIRVGFIHPDLGIGGAEQLVVNLAKDLQSQGCEVKIYTPYHDKKHCFKETIDGTLEVEVRGNLFPASICGKGKAFCAMMRMILATIYVIFFGGYFDVIIVDQVSAVVPLLRLCGRRCIFYCHYPDKLLCTERNSCFKKLYRIPIDYIEELSLILSNMILVNSKYTQEIFLKNFKILKTLNFKPQILYPAIDLAAFDKNIAENSPISSPYFLSLNRYERKKNIGLALTAFAKFKNIIKQSNAKLIIAGGYDDNLTENVEYFKELQDQAKQLNLSIDQDVIFKKNLTEYERTQYIQFSIAVLYTPENEHFGIVPVESMYLQKPVIACNSGGPKESILDQVTGFLINNSDSLEWSKAMSQLWLDSQLGQKMGYKGKERVQQLFGFDKNSLLNFIKIVLNGMEKEDKQL